MTQIKERLSKSVPKPMLINMSKDIRTSQDKNDSEDSQLRISEKAEKVIVELNLMYGESKKKILELIQVLRTEDKLKDNEIKKVLFAKVNFVSKATLYRALPQEFKKEYTKPLPKTINVSTEHKVIDIEPEQKSIPTVDLAPDVEEYVELPEEEDPKDIEIQFQKEKIAQLEDALHKTEQFKPATQLQESEYPPIEYEFKMVNDFLRKHVDGVHSFYYDAYGIDLFKNRELSQLKNSGVRVFKRLYFEV